ncbi:TRAP transporter substrate-binding protein [Brevundimonas bacteroides]|uniref:TRAP transporter substrate-binding protein n=1 Tax=Brevundimonas bacteroides TaxID=74311 RepID=UPI00049722F1|nr:TRAP transporter substrate-binding protein [Brevundimonas bacteroides]
MTATRRALIAAALSVPAVGCVQEIGERPLRVADTHPVGYPTVAAVDHFGRLISERTDGRLRLRNYAGGQLGEEKDTLEITVFGGLDINRVNLAPLNPIEPMTLVPSLPFLFQSTDHMRRSLDGAPGRTILGALERHGLIGLAFYDSGERSFYNTRGPIRTPADMRGLKLRVQTSDLYVALVQALGASPIPMSYGEVFQGLVQGVVDGAENNWPSFQDSRHFEVARYYSLTRHVMAPEVLVASGRTWAKLTSIDRDIIRAAATESVPFMRDLWETREQTARQVVVEAGVQIVDDLDRSAFEAAMRPVWDRFVTSDTQRTLVEQIQGMA